MSTCQFGTLTNFVATQYGFNLGWSKGAGGDYILLYYVQNTCNGQNVPYAYVEYYTTDFWGNRQNTLPYEATLLCKGTTTINGPTGLTVTWDGVTLGYSAFTVTYNGSQISGTAVPGASATTVCCGAQGQAKAPNPIIFTSVCAGGGGGGGGGGPAPGGGCPVPPVAGGPGTSTGSSSFFQAHKTLIIGLGVGIVALIIFIFVMWLIFRKRG